MCGYIDVPFREERSIAFILSTWALPDLPLTIWKADSLQKLEQLRFIGMDINI